VKNQSLGTAMFDDEPTGAGCAAALDATHSAKPAYSDNVVGEGHPAAARWVRAEGAKPRQTLPGRDSLRDLMGPSRHVERIVEHVTQVARSPLTVLIEGETGTGKELVARAIHHASLRCREPFIALDCGAIPDTLIESELFGYEKGAFTGADQRKMGYFQLAHGGSLFLDETVNLPLNTQAKLLRTLQERAVQPVGGRRPIPVNVRIIATSNVCLEREIRAGRFRQDLYYRLNEFIISLPPLRERLEDILYLANRFLMEACQEFGQPIHVISDRAAQLLLGHDWPGNVRQLRSMIRQAVLLAQDGIQPEHLVGLSSGRAVVGRVAASPGDDPSAMPAGRSLRAIAAAAAADAERRTISEAYQAMKGNKSAVARLLGIDYKTLLHKLKRYGIGDHAFESS
jgi:transcriptional regulator with PAS, ATPase and Fis domain